MKVFNSLRLVTGRTSTLIVFSDVSTAIAAHPIGREPMLTFTDPKSMTATTNAESTFATTNPESMPQMGSGTA
jgi:hypothetical protein